MVCAECGNTFLSVYYFFSLRTVGNHCDRLADLLFDKENIVLCFLRELVEFLDASYVALEAGKCFENRFCFLEHMCVREILNDFSVNLVACANLDLVKIAETVESGQANLSCALNLNTVASRTSPYDGDGLLLRRIRRHRRRDYAFYRLPRRKSR